jgi:hypothetical protein
MLEGYDLKIKSPIFALKDVEDIVLLKFFFILKLLQDRKALQYA